jgi:DNA segregation ATPase FtsK/SpoIIIE, S-DNA-T family
MTDLKSLEKRIIEMDERLKKLENNKNWTDALYMKARELVVKYDKASVIFLQRKLLIDFERASGLLDELEKNGIVGPALGSVPRKILIKK